MCVKLLKRYSVIIPVEARLDDDTCLHTKFAYETYSANEKAAKEAARMFIGDHDIKITESVADRAIRLIGEDPFFDMSGDLEVNEGHDSGAEPEVYQGLLRWEDD